MERIVELTPGALRSYGGNYDDYRRQRDTELQAARADLEHAREERRRTRARQQKEHDMSQRRSAQTLRVVDTLNIASFERVAYKSAAKEASARCANSIRISAPASMRRCARPIRGWRTSNRCCWHCRAAK